MNENEELTYHPTTTGTDESLTPRHDDDEDHLLSNNNNNNPPTITDSTTSDNNNTTFIPINRINSSHTININTTTTTTNNTGMNNNRQEQLLQSLFSGRGLSSFNQILNQLQQHPTNTTTTNNPTTTIPNNNNNTTLNTDNNNNNNDNTNNNAGNNNPTTGNNTNNTGNNGPTQIQIQISRSQLFFLLFRLLPILLLPFIIFFYFHYLGIFIFLWFTSITLTSDFRIREQVNLKQERSVLKLFFNLLFLALTITITFLFFKNEQIWKYFYFNVPDSGLVPVASKNGNTNSDNKNTVENPLHSFFGCLFYVFIIDGLIRFLNMIFKTLILIILPFLKIKFIRTQRLLATIENLFLIYRIILPPNIWIRHLLLLNVYPLFFGITMICIYSFFKIGSFFKQLHSTYHTIKNLFSSPCPYGTYLTQEEVLEMGEENGECCICYSAYQKPVKLQCGHVFCEECIANWVQQQNPNANSSSNGGGDGNKTCPICRADVVKKGFKVSPFETGGTVYLVLL
ncbi:hypothetical protein ABK040_001220 [Willaertia magna]